MKTIISLFTIAVTCLPLSSTFSQQSSSEQRLGELERRVGALEKAPSAQLRLGQDFTPEEQALIDKGAVMQMYKPDEHSRHFIGEIDTDKENKPEKVQVVCFVFGSEDAQAAREEGRSMAQFRYTPSETHEFLFAQAWDKYRDRFFTRCYVQQGEQAFDDAMRNLLPGKPPKKSGNRK